jgi:hypothetical protein
MSHARNVRKVVSRVIRQDMREVNVVKTHETLTSALRPLELEYAFPTTTVTGKLLAKYI